MSKILKHFVDPDPAEIGRTPLEFIEFLGGPACIFLTGKEQGRTRALVTLLHGNEPSGTIALHRWLKSGEKPAVNMLCIVASVSAASLVPPFSHRIVPGGRDLNRCFRPPYEDEQGRLAEDILRTLASHQPEAVVDIHNTSGSGPSFSLATFMDQHHDALVSLFTQRLIITHLRLGALMEISEYLCPTVTIECGGREDDEAHQVAFDGLRRYFCAQDVLHTEEKDWGLEILEHPVRLELSTDCDVVFGTQRASGDKLVLDPGIEHLNFGVTARGTQLGWTGATDLTEIFSSKNSRDECVLNSLLYIEERKLLTKQDLKLFMVTTNPEIVKMDCLLYAVTSEGREIACN